MTVFHVDSDEVVQTSQTARSAADRISAETAALVAMLTGLQGSWGGHAASAFQGALADWRATAQVVEQASAALHLALGAAGLQYAEVEQTNARLFLR